MVFPSGSWRTGLCWTILVAGLESHCVGGKQLIGRLGREANAASVWLWSRREEQWGEQ